MCAISPTTSTGALFVGPTNQNPLLQVAADQLVADDVPSGHGHRFGQEPVFAWAATLPPPGWSSDDSTRLAAYLARPGASVIR